MKRFTLAALALFVSVCASPRAGNADQQALKIDKTDDTGLNYFMAPQHSSLDKGIGSNLTVEAWVKPNEMSTDNACGVTYQIVNKEFSYEMTLRNTTNADTGDSILGGLSIAIWPENPDIAGWDWVNSETAVPPGKWTHVAGTWDGLIIRLFVNGKFVKSSDIWTGQNGARGVLNVPELQDKLPEPLRVGRRHDSGPCHQMFDGLIDEVRISKSVRYTEAGFAVPNAAFTADADTVALYHFDEAITGSSTPEATALKDKFKAAGVKESMGSAALEDTDPEIDVQGVSKDASSLHNDGVLVGKAVLVPVTDSPIK